MKYYCAAAVGLTATVLAAGAAHAHHSAAAAFTTNIIEVEGTVTEFNFTNPHINVYFDVSGENGEVTQWMASGSAANLLRRRGGPPIPSNRASTCASPAGKPVTGYPWCCSGASPSWTRPTVRWSATWKARAATRSRSAPRR